MQNKAFKELINFVQGNDKFAFIKGSSQTSNHSAALAALLVCFFGSNSNILFRTTSVKDMESYLSRALSGFWDGDPKDAKFKKRVKEAVKKRNFSISSMNIFIDTINPRSHINTPEKLHAALIYPVEEFCLDYGIKKCLTDLERRNCQKIIFCNRLEDEKIECIEELHPFIIDYREKAV
jgi:hypothetical protein